MPNPLFSPKKDELICENCGYKLVKPYPKDQLCPNCKRFLPNLFEYANNSEPESKKLDPKEFKPKTNTPSSKLPGVRKKETRNVISLDDKKINLKGEAAGLLTSPAPQTDSQ